MLGSFDRCKYMNVRINIGNVKNEYMGNVMLGVNVRMGECWERMF